MKSTLGLCALWLLMAANGNPQQRPNILFAIADDWGWPHAGAYRDPVVKTPTFDWIADEGVLFHHAYVSSPSCTPSRAAILTGQYHWRLEESANLWSTLQTKFPVFSDLLEDAGYFVGYTRKGWGPGRIEPGGRMRNPAGDAYEDFESFLAARPAGRPFTFWFGSSDPHRDYDEGSGAASGMDLDAIALPPHFPDSPEVRGDVADYYWEVERFDREVGELLDSLKRAGELERTVVVITGDHGMPFPRCKGNLYDCGTRVPLAIRWPGVTTSRTVDGFVSLTDLAPTFLEIAGLDPPQEMTGRSLVATLRGAESGRDHVITGKERHVPCQEAPESGGTPMRAIRTADYLYIRNYEPERWPAGTPNYETAFIEGSWYGDIDNGPTKTFMVGHRDRYPELFAIAFGKRPAEELYDLRSDAGQLKNVAAEPRFSDIRKRLSRELERALTASEDPRARGDGNRFDTYPYYGGTPLAPAYEKR